MAKENTIQGMIGVGLRSPHYQYVLENDVLVKWFEVHSENFFYPDRGLSTLLKVRQKYPVSLHGVGLSLGSLDIEEEHLKRLKKLMLLVEPFLISEHLSWNKANKQFLPDLFPIPYNAQSFAVFKTNLEKVQEYLGRHLLIENPSSYLEFKDSDQSEVEFLVDLCKRTGAKILLDVNNVYVSCVNHEWDAMKYISSIPKDMVEEIHLAGHSSKIMKNELKIIIDTHDNHVADEVWSLYRVAIKRFEKCPTLIEWDAKIPEFAVLEAEAVKADRCHYA